MNKISIFLLTVTICLVFAEPPQYNRQQRLRQFSRQEVNPTTTDQGDESVTTQSSGPYQPSGWKPSGRLLVLPSRQQQYAPPQQQYGPPQQEYGPPQEYGTPTTEYGTPDDDSSTTAEASDSSESNETTDEPDSEIVNVEGGSSQQEINFNAPPSSSSQQQPAYFVQLADGSIQQLLYVPTVNSGIGAKLQVQPVVQAQPLFVQPFYVPQTVSFSSQYRSW